jgi:hypothetical protein
MFSFFGAFADLHTGIAEEFRQRWADLDLVEISEPFRGMAIRFKEPVYVPSDEQLPESVSAGVREISRHNPSVRFVLLRTECWGGICANWGQYIFEGRVVLNETLVANANSEGALRRLICKFDVDIGPSEIFEPLSRTFPWQTEAPQ